MAGKCQHTDHHAFVVLRRMTRNGEWMALIIMAVHVRNLQIGFENSCFESHRMNTAMLKELKNSRLAIRNIRSCDNSSEFIQTRPNLSELIPLTARRAHPSPLTCPISVLPAPTLMTQLCWPMLPSPTRVR